MEPKDGGSGLLLGLVVGAALGTALGMLLAPRPGGETLAMLLDRSSVFRERMAEFVEETQRILRVAARRASYGEGGV